MSDWKNPSFPNRSDGKWDKPFLFDEEDEQGDEQMTIQEFVKVILSFLFLSSINGLVLFTVTVLLDYDLSYRNAVLVGMIYVLWRAYDRIVFSKFGRE
jgi:hypothetical protein